MKKVIEYFIIFSFFFCVFCLPTHAREKVSHGRQYNFSERNLNTEFDTVYNLLNKRDSIVVYNSNCIFFGDPQQIGTWKIKVEAGTGNLVFEKREAGAFVTKVLYGGGESS